MIQTLVALVLLFGTVTLADDAPVVETTAGAVRGNTSTSRSGRRFFSYAGLPFAKPPVGLLRFMPPEEPEPWTGVRDATSDGPWCLQYQFFKTPPLLIGDEDCLYLSVYTHDVKASAPVMVHIHGGAFSWGDKTSTGPEFLMDEDVILVDVNYRLGPLGFLSFEDKVMPGNQGMKDQVMALRWIQKNIARFGGDPNKVTIFGESAGGASVTHHIMSPMSRGLFHGGIAESGSSYNLWAVSTPGLAKLRAQRLASLASCPQESSLEAITCFKDKDAIDLLRLTKNFVEWQVDPMLVFIPVLEPPGPEAFLTGPAGSWQPSPVPLLMGITSAEGLLRTSVFVAVNMDYKWFNDNFEKIAPLTLMYSTSASNPNEITRRVRQFYFGDKEISEAGWVNITDMYSDSWFTHGIMETADKHPGDVYFYYFDYMGEYDLLVPKNKSLIFGAGHIGELIYTMNPQHYIPLDLKGEDKELSKKMVKIWTDFAKYGKATSPEKEQNWEKWTPEQHQYMRISNSGFASKKHLIEDRFKFWASLNYKDK